MFSRVRNAKKKASTFPLNLGWTRSVHLSRLDLNVCVLLCALIAYLSITQPQMVAVGGFFTLLALALRLLQYGLETATDLTLPIRSWHLVSLVLALTVVFGHLGLPADAQFFNSLEQTIKEVNTDSGAGIDEGTITTIFIFFRVLIVLAFIVGVTAVLSQAMRGNDWQPIAQMIAVGIAFVIGVEVVTSLILGGATSTTTTP